MNTFFKIGSNQRERNTQFIRPGMVRPTRVDILYSYDTPVAAYDVADHKIYLTTTWHSATTSRHIKKWLEQGRFYGEPHFEMSQDSLWELHHKANIWEAAMEGVTA